MRGGPPTEAGIVPVRIQIVDVEPKILDLTLPTYLPAKDLTQRVARDAGLGAWWEDKGERRRFYLRARGRLLADEEKLEDLGVVPYELLHLLPEPPPGSGLEERPPEYPPNRGYAAAGNLSVAGGMLGVLVWTGLWAMALTVTDGWMVGLLPGIGLSLMCTSLARHLWGGLGSQVRIPVTALVLYAPLLLVAGTPALVLGAEVTTLLLILAPAFIAGAFGVMLGWLAWYGAVEPLPELDLADVVEASAAVTWPCGVCGGAVTVDMKANCTYGCGQVFHVGCYSARQELAEPGLCAVCGFRPA